jgi:hypothetical protein
VWFDIEEGVKLFLSATDIPRALLLLDSLRAQGIRPSDDDGDSLVRVSLTRFDDGALERVRDRLEAAGLVQGFNEIVWGLPPDRR